MLASTAVGIAESWYVGRLGTLALAGLALVFPMFMLMNMLAGGAIGGAIASAVARALGARQPGRAQALALHAVVIALAASGLFMAVFLLGGTAIYMALGATGVVMEAARSYSNVLFAGGLTVWLFHTFASVLRGTGDMRTPASVLVVVSIGQIVLTGILTQGWGVIPACGLWRSDRRGDCIRPGGTRVTQHFVGRQSARTLAVPQYPPALRAVCRYPASWADGGDFSSPTHLHDHCHNRAGQPFWSRSPGRIWHWVTSGTPDGADDLWYRQGPDIHGWHPYRRGARARAQRVAWVGSSALE